MSTVPRQKRCPDDEPELGHAARSQSAERYRPVESYERLTGEADKVRMLEQATQNLMQNVRSCMLEQQAIQDERDRLRQQVEALSPGKVVATTSAVVGGD